MAKQGILGKLKPSAGTDTLLYSAPIDASASTVLNVTAQGGSGTTYDVILKDYDQKLTVDASTYLLHEGDVITNYRFNLNQPIGIDAALQPGTNLTSTDGESAAKFESFFIPEFTTITVRDRSIRAISVESVTDTFVVGDVITKGASPNDTTATVYAVEDVSGSSVLYVGPSTINGSGTEFNDGDALTASGGATGTISVSGVGTAGNEFTLQESGETENLFLGDQITIFIDRTYRFDVSDSSMSGRDFKLSETVNGEWGPDGDFTVVEDNGTEYTDGKTTNGTAGSPGAYIQYDLTANPAISTTIYFYDGGTGTASNANYGGSDRQIVTTADVSYDSIFVYDLDGAAWTAGSDGFEFNGATYTVDSVNAGPYGYVRSYSGTTLYVIKGVGSADFAGTDTFKDCPLGSTVSRSEVTVSSVDVATSAYEAQDVLRNAKTISADTTDEIKSLVIGPAQRVLVNNAAADCSFVLVGFEDNSTAFTTRVFTGAGVAAAASN